MPRGLKRFLVFAACVLVAWYAHRPLLGAGFLGSDAAVLVAVDKALESGGVGALWSVEAVDERPLAAGSLALSRHLHATDGVYTPGDAGRLRLESLILLVIATFGVRAAVIRALRPWTGEDHARSAGAAAGAFLMLHPLLVPVVAHLPARGDVVALAASAWSAALLLEGRQRRRAWAFALAFVLALVAAASSPMALLLVPLGFGLEFVAARRHRPFHARLRTALQVAAGYAAALAIEFAVRALLRPSGLEPPVPGPTSFDPSLVLAPHPAGVLRTLGIAFETTGVVVLPVNTTGLGTLGYVPAVLALLVALHPGFVAARSAPRLWGRVLGGWAIALVVLLVLGTGGVRTQPSRLADAPNTVSLALTMAVGLGISVTAISGGRRAVLPAVVGGLYAVLTAGSAATVQWAAAEVGAVHDVILAAAADDDWRRPEIWVLDPPRDVFGVDALRPEDDSALTAGPFVPPGASPLSVRGLPADSFWALSRSAEFEAARNRGLTLLVPGVDADDGDGLDVRIAVLRIDGRRGEREGVAWVGEGASPSGRSFDPFALRFAAAVVPPDVEADEVATSRPTMHWSSEHADLQRTSGVWVLGPSGPEARFGLERDAAWVLGGTVDSVWFSQPLEQALAVRVTADPEALSDDVRPRVVGDDWTFDVAGESLAAPADTGANETWVLHLLDPVSGRSAEIAPTGAGTGRLVAEGAARLEGYDVLWVLDRALDGVVVQRARGRRGPRP